MIDIRNLAEIVGPFRAAVFVILARLAWRRLPARQHGCNRRKKIASVKAGREPLGLPCDVPPASHGSAAKDEFEQAVARADIPAVIGFDDDGRPCDANPGSTTQRKTVPAGNHAA
jgi:hypothetical protein